MLSFNEWTQLEESAGSRLASISKKQKENTGNYLDELQKKGDKDAAEMKKIKAAWGKAGKPGTLSDFAKNYGKK